MLLYTPYRRNKNKTYAATLHNIAEKGLAGVAGVWLYLAITLCGVGQSERVYLAGD